MKRYAAIRFDGRFSEFPRRVQALRFLRGCGGLLSDRQAHIGAVCHWDAGPLGGLRAIARKARAPLGHTFARLIASRERAAAEWKGLNCRL